MSDKFDVAIVGGGAAGVMAALRGVLNNDKVALFMGGGKSKKRSRAQWVSKVENIPGYDQYKKGIVNPNQDALKFIESSPFKDNLTKVPKTVAQIEKTQDGFVLQDEKGETYHATYVVLATGVMDVQPHIQGSMEPILPYANVQLVDYCIRCDGHHIIGKDTTIIGHSNVAAWVAVILYERYKTPSMTILTNGEQPEFEESTQKLLDLYGIKVETSPIQSIEGNAKELVLESFTLEDGKVIKNQISFVSLGMIVYNELAKSLGAKVDDRGFVRTNEKSETSIEGVYAIGDLKADTKKQIYTGWDNAVDALDDINNKIRREKREQLLANQ